MAKCAPQERDHVGVRADPAKRFLEPVLPYSLQVQIAFGLKQRTNRQLQEPEGVVPSPEPEGLEPTLPKSKLFSGC